MEMETTAMEALELPAHRIAKDLNVMSTMELDRMSTMELDRMSTMELDRMEIMELDRMEIMELDRMETMELDRMEIPTMEALNLQTPKTAKDPNVTSTTEVVGMETMEIITTMEDLEDC